MVISDNLTAISQFNTTPGNFMVTYTVKKLMKMFDTLNHDLRVSNKVSDIPVDNFTKKY